MRLAAIALIGGCVGYTPSYVGPTDAPFVAAAVGCFNITVAFEGGSTIDREASGPVLFYRFVNHCDRAALIDLASIRATANNTDLTHTALTAYDPQHELRPLLLESGGIGQESIEYDGEGVEVVTPALTKGCAEERLARATGLADVLRKLDEAERDFDARQAQTKLTERRVVGDPATIERMQRAIDAAEADSRHHFAYARGQYEAKLGPAPCMNGSHQVNEAHALQTVCVELGRIDPARPTQQQVCMATSQ